MAVIVFATLKEAKTLERSGFSQKQAEAIVTTAKNSQEANLSQFATKGDLYRGLFLQTFAIGGIIIAAMKFL